MKSIYDLDDEYDEDIISVKKLMVALDRNINDDDILALAQILKVEESQLRRALSSINHIDIVKW